MITFPKSQIIMTVALTSAINLILAITAVVGVVVLKAQNTTLEYVQSEYNANKQCWEMNYYPWLDGKVVWPMARRSSGCLPQEPNENNLDAANALGGAMERLRIGG